MKIRIVILLVLVLASMFVGYGINELLRKPEVITVEKPIEIEKPVYIVVDKPVEVIKEVPIKKIVYQEVPVIEHLSSTDNVDLDYLLHMLQLGMYSHYFYVLNPSLQNEYVGDTKTNQEWLDFYHQIDAIIREIKEKQNEKTKDMPEL